jgi:hypothetical protein
MLGHIEDKRRKLLLLEKSLLNALCAAFDPSRSALGPARVPLRTSVRVCLGLIPIVCNRAKSEGPFMAHSRMSFGGKADMTRTLDNVR